MPRITPCLWFDTEAEEAAALYVSLFPGSRIVAVSRYGEGGMREPGTVMMVDFELDGQGFQALNGGPQFPQTEAVSFSIPCADQAEIDRYSEGLIAGGGSQGPCGWLKDRFGVSWQVVPAELATLMSRAEPERAARVMQALLGMRRIDIAGLRAAADGA